MMLKRRLYELARGGPTSRADATEDLPVTFLELLGYMLRRGLGSWLRGLVWRFRLGASGGRLFVGRGARIVFPRRIVLGRDVVIGEGCYVNGLARRGVRIGDHVRLQKNVWCQATSDLAEPGEGIEIGEGTYIGPGSILGAGGGIRIGRDCLLGAGVDLLAENHRFDDLTRRIREQGVTRRGITIGDNVWIGNKAIVIDGVTVGSGAVIGAGAVVTRDVPPDAVIAGNPARLIRSRGRAPEAPRPAERAT